MNKEITPNEIANAIKDLLEERDEFQERLKEQDKSLRSWFNDYHKLKNKYDKQKKVLDKIKDFIEEFNKNVSYLRWNEDDYVDYIKKIEELLEEIE